MYIVNAVIYCTYVCTLLAIYSHVTLPVSVHTLFSTSCSLSDLLVDSSLSHAQVTPLTSQQSEISAPLDVSYPLMPPSSITDHQPSDRVQLESPGQLHTDVLEMPTSSSIWLQCR